MCADKRKGFLVCDTCQKEFDRKQYSVGHKFCSIGCQYWGSVDYNKKGCWFWQRRISSVGYPVLRWKGEEFQAAKVGYSIWNNLEDVYNNGRLYNVCGNRNCVRGDHWEPIEK